MSFMGIKLLSHLMKLLHLMNLSSQQFYLCSTLFNVHDTLRLVSMEVSLEFHDIKYADVALY